MIENMTFWIGHILFWICLGAHNIFRKPTVKNIAWYGVIFFIGFMAATLLQASTM